MKIVLSASRRTDIPAFYMNWFMNGLDAGAFEVENPVSRRITRVPASPETVHTIVLWSKNFGPFLRQGYAQELHRRGYHLFFHFTLNAEDRLLEPRIPPLESRLEQMAHLARQVPPDAITWRFDPLCFYRCPGSRLRNNLEGFATIARRVAGLGITRCTTSFMDHYPKIDRRLHAHPGLRFEDPSLERRLEILLGMEAVCRSLGMDLSLCCEAELVTALPADSRIHPGACISHKLLLRLYGGTLSCKPDRTQRRSQGCGCQQSRDIGSYRRQPCYHNCLFCYANPCPAAPPSG